MLVVLIFHNMCSFRVWVVPQVGRTPTTHHDLHPGKALIRATKIRAAVWFFFPFGAQTAIRKIVENSLFRFSMYGWMVSTLFYESGIKQISTKAILYVGTSHIFLRPLLAVKLVKKRDSDGMFLALHGEIDRAYPWKLYGFGEIGSFCIIHVVLPLLPKTSQMSNTVPSMGPPRAGPTPHSLPIHYVH